MKTLLESIIGRKGISSITKQSLQEGDIVESAAGTFFVFVPKYYSDKHDAFITPVGMFGKFQIAANHTNSWDDDLKAGGGSTANRRFDIVRVYRKPQTKKFLWDVWKNPIELKDYINWIKDNVNPIDIN
jgi:hypothetical protein